MGLPGVTDVHDLHVRAMGTLETALTAHLVVTVARGAPDNLLRAAADQLHYNFRIDHATLQLESAGFAQTCSVSTLNCQLPRTGSGDPSKFVADMCELFGMFSDRPATVRSSPIFRRVA